MRNSLMVLTLLWLCTALAWADPKKEMLGLLDRLATGGAAAEAAVDWDNLIFKTPQLKEMDLHAAYAGLPPEKQAAFRKGFVANFSKSFQKISKGKKFSDSANVPGAMNFDLKGDTPSIVLPAPTGKITVGYVRKNGALKINKVLLGAKPSSGDKAP